MEKRRTSGRIFIELVWGIVTLIVAAALAYGVIFALGALMIAASSQLSGFLRASYPEEAAIRNAFVVLDHVLIDGSTNVVIAALVVGLTWLLTFVLGPQPRVPADLRRRRSWWWGVFGAAFVALGILAYVQLSRISGLVLGPVEYFLALIVASACSFIVLWAGMLVAIPVSWMFAIPGSHWRMQSSRSGSQGEAA